MRPEDVSEEEGPSSSSSSQGEKIQDAVSLSQRRKELPIKRDDGMVPRISMKQQQQRQVDEGASCEYWLVHVHTIHI